MATFLTYKRWRLRDGVDMQAVIDMVRDRIVPHYEAQSSAIGPSPGSPLGVGYAIIVR